jgi:hypothetical protein
VQEVLDDNKKKIFTMKLRDPEPRVPGDFNLFPPTNQGDYMLVAHKTMESCEKKTGKKFEYLASEGMILTKHWEIFEDNMKVQDLIDLEDDFLIYHQCLSVTTKANKLLTTDRDKSLAQAKKRKNPGGAQTSNSNNKRAPRRGGK